MAVHPSYLSVTEMGNHSLSQGQCFRPIFEIHEYAWTLWTPMILRWALSRTCLSMHKAEGLFDIECWELYVNDIFLVSTLHQHWKIRWFPLYLQKQGKIFQPQWLAPFKGLARAVGDFSTGHFRRACALFWKKQVSGNVWCDKWTITKKKLLK